MKTAKEIKKIQKNAIREEMENKLVHMAKNRYTEYCCPTVDCPEWLQEELIRKGFKIEKHDNKIYNGITIYW